MESTILSYQKRFKEAYTGLNFVEETHTYTVDDIVLPSVSGLIKNFYTEFDSKNIGFNYSKSRGLELLDVLDAWEGEGDIAANRGTEVHNFGENYAKWKYFGVGTKPKVGSKQELGIIQFYNDLPKHIYPVELELRMYHKLYSYAGTSDIILYNEQTDTLIIADFKTNKSLSSEYDQQPLFYIPNELGLLQDNLGKYTLQIGGFYRILLEDEGFKVSNSCLVWLQEKDKKLYQNIFVKNVATPVRDWLDLIYK